MTPATLEFFLRVFHDNKDNFDEAGNLRPDLQVVGKGLAKLLYGARIDPDSRTFEMLEKLFDSDTCRRALNSQQTSATRGGPQPCTARSASPRSRELDEAITAASVERQRHEREKAERAKRNGRPLAPKEVADLRAIYRQRSAPFREVIERHLANAAVAKQALADAALGATTVADIYAEMIGVDAESVHTLEVQRRTELATIIDLCKEAAAEARELNETVGKYMTFVC
jgi:hypothetical protein